MALSGQLLDQTNRLVLEESAGALRTFDGF
jgi:hypothetical protein